MIAFIVAALLTPAPPPDCHSLYFGIDGPRDLPAALVCYRKENDWLVVAVMLINGEGGPVDLPGARAAYTKLLAERGGGPDGDAQALDTILQRREANPKGRWVDFCADVAQTTYTTDICASIDGRLQQRQARERIARLRAGLTPEQATLLDGLVDAADRFTTADGARLYQDYIEGTIRNMAMMMQERAVRASFMDRLAAWGDRRALPHPTRSLAAADRELNRVYQRTLGTAAADQKAAREAQRAWIRYRDAFAGLVVALHPEARDVDAAVRSLLSDDRIAQLKHDPVAPAQ